MQFSNPRHLDLLLLTELPGPLYTPRITTTQPVDVEDMFPGIPTPENDTVEENETSDVENEVQNGSSTVINIILPDDIEDLKLLVVFTMVNATCFLVFCPANIKTMKLYFEIMRRGQPFFGLFIAIQVCGRSTHSHGNHDKQG